MFFVYLLLSKIERKVSVLDHVHDLPLDGEKIQKQPVAQQDRPEHRYIQKREESHDKRNHKSLSSSIPKNQIGTKKIKTCSKTINRIRIKRKERSLPEFELGKTTNKGLKLISIFTRQSTRTPTTTTI